jgi:hypothetical protein
MISMSSGRGWLVPPNGLPDARVGGVDGIDPFRLSDALVVGVVDYLKDVQVTSGPIAATRGDDAAGPAAGRQRRTVAAGYTPRFMRRS